MRPSRTERLREDFGLLFEIRGQVLLEYVRRMQVVRPVVVAELIAHLSKSVLRFRAQKFQLHDALLKAHDVRRHIGDPESAKGQVENLSIHFALPTRNQFLVPVACHVRITLLRSPRLAATGMRGENVLLVDDRRTGGISHAGGLAAATHRHSPHVSGSPVGHGNHRNSSSGSQSGMAGPQPTRRAATVASISTLRIGTFVSGFRGGVNTSRVTIG